MTNDMRKWMSKGGRKFLKEIGIKRGQTVLDFGCSVGNYSIPSALVVGEKGKVYAVDKNKKSLDELMQRAKKLGLKNIERIDVSEEIKLALQKESFDAVLLYDVIHLVNNRNGLLTEIYRVSKPNALISVYPKHHREHMNMELDDVKDEVESLSFSFETEFYKKLMHDDCLEKGYILNFRKKILSGE
jgi:ubiquinone/menaquinone biosynthesis C-methylase UbiE